MKPLPQQGLTDAPLSGHSGGHGSRSCLGRPLSGLKCGPTAHLLSAAVKLSTTARANHNITGQNRQAAGLARRGLILMPGPMVADTVTLRKYCPLAAAGLALTSASIKADKFSSNCSSAKDTLPI